MSTNSGEIPVLPAASVTKSPQPDVAVLPNDPRDVSLDSLIERAQKGDEGAFATLMSRSRPRALAVALKVVRNPDDAEDAVQDAFLKIWRYLDRFERRASFTTWLHRIVMNASLDVLRRQASRHEIYLGEAARDEDGEGLVVEAAHEETPERQLQRRETGAVVHAALAALSPEHRQAVSLRELEECSYEEIAGSVGCPVGTVMSRLHHARRNLAAELQSRRELSNSSLRCAA